MSLRATHGAQQGPPRGRAPLCRAKTSEDFQATDAGRGRRPAATTRAHRTVPDARGGRRRKGNEGEEQGGGGVAGTGQGSKGRWDAIGRGKESPLRGLTLAAPMARPGCFCMALAMICCASSCCPISSLSSQRSRRHSNMFLSDGSMLAIVSCNPTTTRKGRQGVCPLSLFVTA